MILDIKWKNTYSEELWKLIVRANNLSGKAYSSWADNASTLTRIMEQILTLSRKECAWNVHFTTILKLFYLVRRDDVLDLKTAFKIAEIYHHDYGLYMDEAMAEDSNTGHVSYCICSNIIEFYLSYPQITDEKMEQMLHLFYENDARYGVKYNNYNYGVLLTLGLFNNDRDMVKRAHAKLEAGDYTYGCYICYYAKRIIDYYIYDDDYDGMIDIIQRVSEKSIPAKYKSCYDNCEDGDETQLVSRALDDCLTLGKAEFFSRLFTEKIHIYRQPCTDLVTCDAVFHALAGDWLLLEESLELAETDNLSRVQHKQVPLVSMYDALYWKYFFQLLDNSGTHTVHLALSSSDSKSQGEKSLWSCTDVAAYFERQADEMGAQMVASRKHFQYALIKQTFEKCLSRPIRKDGQINEL